MSFDKAKVLRAAEKYLTQGKIAPAITEYCKIVAEEPGDFTALNMLGDLYERTGKNTEAIQCFLRIALHYREQGFNLKAIAMFKKIYRLQPANPEVAYQLGALYETQGLAMDARTQYLVVADHHQRAGDMRKTLEILHRVADLDSHNVETRLKLAEGYLKEGLQDQSAAAFAEAGKQLLSRKNYERALAAFNRALSLAPAKYEVWSGIVEAHIALNSPNEAAEMLCQQGALEKNDTELLALLTQAYLADENAPAAEQSAQRLVSLEPSSYSRVLDVARLYLKTNQLDDCVRLLNKIVESILNSRAEAALIYVLNEVVARNPEHLPALNMLVRVHQWCHDEERLQKTLERILEVAGMLQLPDEERAALKQLKALLPHHEGYRQRLQELGEPFTEPPLPVHTPMPESEADFYNSLAGLASTVATTEEEEDANFEILSQAETEYAGPSATENVPEPQTWEDYAAHSFADLNEDEPEVTPLVAIAGPPAPPEMEPAGLDEHHLKILRQELESVDFYIAQGYHDIAQDTLEMLIRQFGEQPSINARLARIATIKEPLAQVPSPAWVSEETPVAAPVESAQPHTEALYFTESMLFEANSEVAAAEEVSFVDNASSLPMQFVMETTLTVPQVVTEPPAWQQPPESLSFSDAFSDEAPAPAFARNGAQPASNGTAPPLRQAVSQSGLDPGLAEVFDEFRVAVEEETQLPADDDFETHYNLGLAYQEMELVDEAVEEFQIAAKLVSPEDGTPRYLHCCNLLGHCFMSKRLPRVAARWFQKGMAVKGILEDSYLAMLYDLGIAYEEMGESEKALDSFMEVYGINVTYRGVSEKLRELQQLQAA